MNSDSFPFTKSFLCEKAIAGRIEDSYSLANEVRQLDAFEQELIPLFKIMRAVVTIGIPVMNLHHWGRANIEPWFKYSFENIEQSMKQIEGATD